MNEDPTADRESYRARRRNLAYVALLAAGWLFVWGVPVLLPNPQPDQPFQQQRPSGSPRAATLVTQARTLAWRGRDLLRAGDPASAVTLLRRSLAMDPDDTLSRGLLWTAYRDLGRQVEAEEVALLNIAEPWRPHARLATRLFGARLVLGRQLPGAFDCAERTQRLSTL